MDEVAIYLSLLGMVMVSLVTMEGVAYGRRWGLAAVYRKNSRRRTVPGHGYKGE